VSLTGAAFQLTRAGGGPVGGFTTSAATIGGVTVVTLGNFTGAETDGGSLADGRYTLTVAAAAVTANGMPLDGNGDGTSGDSYVSPADTAAGGPGQLRLYRLFGDATGNGVVDLSDLVALRGTFNAGLGSPVYLHYLDADGNGTVDLADLGEFRSRFNRSVF
jgi:hypothetical protein